MPYDQQGQYRIFVKAVEACKHGVWDQARMAEFLTAVSKILSPKAEHIFEAYDDEEYRAGAEEECCSAEEGIAHYEQGMEIMWEFTEDGNLDHLSEGLKVIKDGNDLMNRALTLNRDAYEELEIQFFM